MSENMKKVKEVFNEIEDVELGNCTISNISLYKKTNKLQVDLLSVEAVSNISLQKFEDYLKNKFKMKDIIVNIAYEETIREGAEKTEEKKSKRKEDSEDKENTSFIVGKKLNSKVSKVKVIDIDINTRMAQVQGEVVDSELRETKNGYIFIRFDIYDGTSTIVCKTFVKESKDYDRNKEFALLMYERIKNAKGLCVSGNVTYDPYNKELNIMCNQVMETEGLKKVVRVDNAEVKRVELHAHTKMSAMDGVTTAEDLINQVAAYGMKAVAITDHGVVQAFPEANKISKKKDIKIIYGVEAYLAPDNWQTLDDEKKKDLGQEEYCIFDIETTGLSAADDKITEIGAVKMKNGEIIDEFECFVNPRVPIPTQITELTGITDDMVKNAEPIECVLPKLIEFIGDSTIVAHNAEFDMGFIKYNAKKIGLKVENKYIDTLKISRQLFPEFKKHKLGIIAENLGIIVENAHRALDDVKTLAEVFKIMLEKLQQRDDEHKINVKDVDIYHAIILATNQTGLKNLYKLISYSHIDYFHKKPRIPKSVYLKHKEGLIIGSGCEKGELFHAFIVEKSKEEIKEIAEFYDYLEIQPLGNNDFLVRNENITSVQSREDIIRINREIVALGENLNKPVVATCDVHFLNPEDEIYRKILLAGQGFEDADQQAPLYLRTTEEMLKEFEYLGTEKSYEVVVTNTNKINDMCEAISPIADEMCTPKIEGAEEEIEKLSFTKARELYGEKLPIEVEERLKKELNSIIKNGFSVMYIIAQKLVWKSLEAGYLVGSRGSVGSSLVAYMTDITEVNPLPPHYVCPNCKYSDFTNYGVPNGVDLPDKTCPQCANELNKNGVDIPFETFLGFDGDKAPDIDLNFSGEYQGEIHRYTEELFKTGKTYKAGTISTIAEKSAIGFVLGYFRDRGIEISNAEVNRLKSGCAGIKKTTGQHPGGIIVVPEGREIYEFCPIQRPADNAKTDIITTHFDFHSIDENLLKLDILGHDDPTVIRMLQDITGIDPKDIPLDDKKVMSLFSSTEALGIFPEQIDSIVGTFGVPEFGTKFVRDMLIETTPTKFEELIRISGLSHGTDVWKNNTQDLIKKGITDLSGAICTRDDIMTYLIQKGLASKMAFKIMENVRKGKGLTEEMEEAMKEQNVPDWYIESCKKIKYMFPKAHATAYVTTALKIAWFKVYHPEAFYASYLSVRADEFDSDIMIHGKDKVKDKMKKILEMGYGATDKDKNMYPILEIVLEMYERGIKFLPIDLYKSDAKKFLLEQDGIRPPISSIPGLGLVAAQGIVDAREDGKFMSIEDLRIRGKIGKSVIEMLEKEGCVKGMNKSNQVSLF